jgi:hypothetical protein
MATVIEVPRTSTRDTMKEEVLHIENARPHTKSRFSRTKDLTAEDFASILTPSSAQNYDLLQASPYSDRSHLLDLSTLTKPLRLFAEALTGMRWITREFATTHYDRAFNWDSIVDIFSRAVKAEQTETMPKKLDFYVIVFHSRVNGHADRQLLGELDKAAHLEAVESGGLLKYWFGEPDEAGRNLATCEFSYFLMSTSFVCLTMILRLVAQSCGCSSRRRRTRTCSSHASCCSHVRRVVCRAFEVDRRAQDWILEFYDLG